MQLLYLKKSLYRNGIIKKIDSYKITVKFKDNSKEVHINFIHELEKNHYLKIIKKD